MEIGKTSYNVEAVKLMTVSAFLESHKHLTEIEAKAAYYRICGGYEKAAELPKKRKKSEPEPEPEPEDVSTTEQGESN